MSHSFLSSYMPNPISIFKITALAFAVSVAGCNNTEVNTSTNNANSDVSIKMENQSEVAEDSDSDVVASLEENLKASGFNQKIISAIPTKMENIYWVTAEGMPAFFSDKEGRFVIQGDIIEIGQEQPIDISSDLVANKAKQSLANIDKDELIIYPATGETKAAVYIFTDADCPYCTKLHQEMQDINELGIEVRYLAWPRSERSIPKMDSIWCSEDRNAAMNQVKSGQPIIAPSCNSPVRDHIRLGMSLGVSGTPAIYTESGHQIGGYLPAKQLADAAIEIM